jgi:beta-lactam-binding protein with PASTA domain
MTRSSGRKPRLGKDTGAPAVQGRYVLQDAIGRGGIATVYRAVDVTLDRLVAVKLLDPQLCREPLFIEQFLHMEQRIARLFHPHLATIYDAGATDDSCFVVMEYVPGGSLRDLLAGSEPLPLPRVLKLITQVAEALQTLHSERIIHGDIKPDNVLLDEDGNAKLVDFGIARLATTTGAISSGNLEGTAPYLAPEQLEHGQSDASSDIYALGVMAYELLAGRKPFEGDSWVAVAAERLERDPDPLTEVRPELPAELSNVMMRALARDPRERFQSAQQFRQALELVELEPPRAATAPSEMRTIPPEVSEPRVGMADELGSRIATATSVGQARLATAGARSTFALRRLTSKLARVLRRQRPASLAALAGLALVVLLAAGIALSRALNPPHPVIVPQVSGQTLEAARVVVRGAGLNLTVSEEPSETVARGTILRQEPAANNTIQSDESLRAVVSAGPPPIKVPDLNQRRLDDARKDLGDVGLVLGKVEEREVSEQPWGAVIGQSVRAGSDLARGGTVDVTVAMPPWTNAPKLVDRPVGEAEVELEKRGLRLGTVRVEPVGGKRAGTVTSQDPAADLRLRQGSSVSVTISVPPSAPQPATKP